MNISIHKYMKVGIIHFMAYPSVSKGEGPVLETLKKIAADDYFKAVEITHMKDADIRKRAKAILDASGITVVSGWQPVLLANGLNINDTDEAGRQQAVNALKYGIDEAYEMGSEDFSFLSGIYEECNKEKAYDALLRSTRELCSYAKQKGNMKIELEVFDYDVDKKSLIGPVSLVKRFAEEMRRDFDNFGLIVDLSHLPLIRETAEQAILPVSEYITHAHIGNCVIKDPNSPAYGDQHPRFNFPGGENGAEELAEFLRILKRTGFLNETNPPIVSFEVKPFGDEDPDIVIAGSKRVLEKAWLLV